MSAQSGRRVGRGIQKLFILSPDLNERLEDFRFSHRYKSESAAVRDLIRAGLDAMKVSDKQGEREAELRAA